MFCTACLIGSIPGSEAPKISSVSSSLYQTPNYQSQAGSSCHTAEFLRGFWSEVPQQKMTSDTHHHSCYLYSVFSKRCSVHVEFLSGELSHLIPSILYSNIAFAASTNLCVRSFPSSRTFFRELPRARHTGAVINCIRSISSTNVWKTLFSSAHHQSYRIFRLRLRIISFATVKNYFTGNFGRQLLGFCVVTNYFRYNESLNQKDSKRPWLSESICPNHRTLGTYVM